MKVALLPPEQPLQKEDGKLTGSLTDSWANYFEQNQINMSTSLSDEGFQIPSVTGSQMATLQDSQNVPAGRLVFNQDAVNGGSSDAPNGQLYIKLRDGLFHPITNT
jgi:hypothetical protein